MATALANYEQVLACASDLVEAHANHSRALIALRRYGDALANCHWALALSPDFAEVHNNCGSALASLGREDEATASYDKAIALKPDYATAHDNKGVALLQLGALTRPAPPSRLPSSWLRAELDRTITWRCQGVSRLGTRTSQLWRR